MSLQALPLPDAELLFDPVWLCAAEADALFAALREGIAWERHRIRLFGREVDSPRLSCWIGDPGAAYTYSRTRFAPHPWPPALAALRGRVSAAAGECFDSVLANLYRDGADGMGWHSDDEPALGPAPVIASLSLGAARRFVLRHRRDQARQLALELPHGSLLVMRGATQRHYRHALPKTARPVGARINLTFRRIVHRPMQERLAGGSG
ncbi:alpha-ketoglutarate-dependent dioxygenase AlkB family protein [Rehaibacterium terrae]|uniref:Alkylated DNA repair dioxygenase AlkB n=1 Tax=Rehaibacterium terrae TaxID=1341696 RepID=A0A7W7V7B8_9GAMM|nr:alpha-ketoglutarate-dependent dioxygenase AlkB [Rehaibacterium terrae]MBB5014477.1 alkylated DNA repair dioxygenase AlkB [Rehaibacterium terrae]